MDNTPPHPPLVSRILDTASQLLLPAIAWFPLAMAILTVAVVSLRYGWGIGAIAAQEGVLYLHSALFLLGISWTLAADGHVRVDIFYRQFSSRQKAWVDALGHTIFTLPLCVLIGITSWGYVAESWAIAEVSAEPGGIPAVFLLKSLIPIMTGLLFLQACSEIVKALQILISETAYAG